MFEETGMKYAQKAQDNILHPVLLQSFFSDFAGCFLQADFPQQCVCFSTGISAIYGFRIKTAKAMLNMNEKILTLQI